MSLNVSQSQQQPADLGSEASFGQETVLRELAHETSDIQSYLRSLKEKQMAQISRVFKSHSDKLEESEREITQSLREIQVEQTQKQKEVEVQQIQKERQRIDEEHYQRLLSVKPQTVEEIREKVKLQLQFEQRVASSSQLGSGADAQNKVVRAIPTVSVASPPKNKKKKKVVKGTLWYYENREKAEYEFALREFLKEKELKKYVQVEPPKTFNPIIIKPEERRKYEQFRELDYEAATPCSEDRSNFAFETGNEIIANFKQIFENFNASNTSKSKVAARRKRYRIKDFRDDELKLIAHLFARIPDHEVEEADPSADFVKKEDFEEELLSMREILILYNIKSEELGKELLKFSTSRPGYLNLREAGEFLTMDRDSVAQAALAQVKRVKKRITEEQLGNPKSLLSEEQMKVFRDIFLEIDTFGDMKVSLKQFMHKIRTDIRTKDWIERPAAFVKEVQRFILLEDIFNEWDQWMGVGKEQERRTKESIDWRTFEEMILHYKRKDIPSRDKIFAAQKLLGRYDFGDTLEIPKEFLKAIKDTIANLPKYALNYVNINDFLADIKANKLFILYQSKFVREKKYLDLEIETINDVIRRMDQECENFHTQDEILEFFSRKGRPKYLARVIRLERQNELLQRGKGDGADSDDSDDDDGKKRAAMKEKRRQRQVAKIIGSSEEDAKKQLEKNLFMANKNFGAQFKSKDEEYFVTVPEPFNFDSRDKNKVISIRQRKLNEMLQEKQDVEDALVETATAFRANKIPKHIKNTKLWSQIMAKNSERREQVKKESKSITLSRENPFSFYYRDLQKVKERRNAVPEKFKVNHFKAKHAPWTSLVLLYDRLLERQAKRTKENVEKRRVELAETSKLPEGVRNMLKRLKAKDDEMEEKRNTRLNEYSFQPPRAKPIPNFADLQKSFSDKLAEKKGDFTPTVVVPFRFQETRKGVTRDYLDKENQQVKQSSEGVGKENRERRLRRILNMKVKLQPPSTKKFEALVQKNRQVQEQKEYNRMVSESREVDKHMRREKFAEFVNSCIRNVNHSEYRNQLNALKEHQRDEKLREKYEWEQQFDEKMTDMMRNVIRRPLLIEQVSQKDFSSERAMQLQMILGGNGEVIQEEMEGEDEEGIYLPNFDQMNEQELRQYLDPHSVDPKTLEARKYFYLQHIQRSGHMPDINEMDEEEEDPNGGSEYDNQMYAEQQGMEEGSPQDEQEYDQENEEDGQYQEGENGDVHHDGEEQDEEEDFQKNEEFIEQQKQVQQIQKKHMHGDDDQADQGALGSSSAGRNSNSAQQMESQSQQASKGMNENQSAGPTSQKGNHDGLDYEYEDDDDDDEYEYQDENGNPIPAHIVKQYQQQMREMGKDPGAQYDNEEDDDDYSDEDDDENVQYIDDQGNELDPAIVANYKEQRKQERKRYQEQFIAQQESAAVNQSIGRDQKSVQQDGGSSKHHSAQPSQAVGQKAAAAAPISPGHSDYEVDEDGQPIMKDDDEDDGEAAYIQTQSQQQQEEIGNQDEYAAEYDEDEEFDEEKYEYVDENGNPIDPEVIKYLQQQQKLEQQGGMLEDQEFVDSKSDSESAAAAKKQEKSQDSYVDKNDVKGEEIEEDEMGNNEEDEDDEEEEVYYDQYNQRIPAGEVRKYKEMAARGEIDMEEYDDGEEPQFETQEEYINYYVDLQMKEFKAQGKVVSEAEVRKMITEQILAEQQEQDEIDQELEDAIAQMRPEELAQFVDESGRQMTKDQIKDILMQQQAEDAYYEGEGYEQYEEEQGQYAHPPQAQLKHNSSF